MSNEPRPSPDPPRALVSAVVAFGMWGVFPIYWMQVQHLGSAVVVFQRLVWTVAWLAPVLVWAREWRACLEALRTPRLLRLHASSAVLLSINWSLFIWANQHGRIVEASLGYFLNPLLNVLIGRSVFGEHLSRWRMASVALAGIGVLLQIVLVGHLPWVALSIAVTFALYGLLRRQSPLGSLVGLGVESALAFPVAVVALFWMGTAGVKVFGDWSVHDLLLILLSGAVTAAPLLTFAYAARHLRFSTLGLLQFLAPTGQFLVGTWVYHEPVSVGSLVSFVFIWLGVAVFCGEGLRGRSTAPRDYAASGRR